jgi:hypothetical protein
MPTYKEIQSWVKQNYGFVPKTCWIAEMKEKEGLPVRKAPNRKDTERVYPCPAGKEDAIRAAFHHLGMI